MIIQAWTVARGPKILNSIHDQGLKFQGDVDTGCRNPILKDLSFGVIVGYLRAWLSMHQHLKILLNKTFINPGERVLSLKYTLVYIPLELAFDVFLTESQQT